MNRALQPRPLVVLGLNVWMGTAAGARLGSGRRGRGVEGVGSAGRRVGWATSTTKLRERASLSYQYETVGSEEATTNLYATACGLESRG